MLAGPYATMLLADLGAEVIKIEPPGGEISRQVSDSYFASLNRNKQSVCLDLRSEAGRKRLGVLVANSHALLVNMKPSAINRLGLTYEALREFNERIVCVAMTGFGSDGGDDPAFDYVIQAATGVAANDWRSVGATHAAWVFVGRQFDRACRGTRPARTDRLGPGRASGCVAARRDAVAAELPGLGLPQRRLGAAAVPVRGAFVLRSGSAFLDGGRRPGVVHHPRRVLEILRRRGRDRRLPDDGRARGEARRSARRRRRRRWPPTPLRVGSHGCGRSELPAAAVRTLPEALEATPEAVVTAGDFRLVGSPIRIAGYEPDYRPPPLLDEHGGLADQSTQSS